MAVDVNEDRINRWKCLTCGSKHKKIINHIRKSDKKHVGYTLFCCNCGHLETFAWTVNAAIEMSGENLNSLKTGEIKCGLLEKDLVNCENYSCPYRPKEKEKGPSKTVRTAIAKEIIPKNEPMQEDRFDEERERSNINKEHKVIPPTQIHAGERHYRQIPTMPGQVGAPYIPPHGNITPTFAPPDPMRGPEIPMDISPDIDRNTSTAHPHPPVPLSNGRQIEDRDENFTIPVINGSSYTSPGKL